MTAPGEPGRLRAPDGLALHFRAWRAEHPRSVLLVAHGIGEHSGRYHALAADLAREGVAVVALDFRGHGLSGGRRGHVHRFDDYLGDLEALRREVAAGPLAGLPTMLLGHSLGGLIAVRYAEEHPEAPLSGLVLSAPALRLVRPQPAWLRGLAALLERVAPALPLHNGVDDAELSRDPEVVRAYREDPLVHHRITPRLYCEMLRAMDRAVERRDRIRVPAALVIAAGADRIVSPEAVLDFAAGMPGEVATRCYRGYYHEAFNDLGREAVIADLLGWLRARGG